MATMTLTSSYKSSMQIQLTYEVSPGQFKLTSIKGRRTDGYLTQSYNGAGGEMIYVTVGGTQKTFNSTGIYFANTSSSWSDAWANCSGTWTGLSGTESIYITLDSTQNVTNIDKSTFSGSVYVTPPASTITNNTSTSSRINFGSNVTFTITRPTTSTTHKLTYTVGGTTYTIADAATTSATYAFPTSLISNYPSGTIANITVNCANSNGSSSSTVVYLQVPSSYVPTVNMTLSSSSFFPDGWSGSTTVMGPDLLQGFSTMNVAVTASGVSGSTISSYSVKVDNVGTYDKANFTTGILKTPGRQSVVATVTDTRGRTASIEKEFYVTAYSAPYITNLKAMRCNSSGTLTEEGTYAKISFDYYVDSGDTDINYFYITASCNGTNVTLFDGEDSNHSGSYTSGPIFSGLSTDLSYLVAVKLSDAVYTDDGAAMPSLNYSTTVSPSAVTISKLAGGKGISFGQTASQEGLHSYMTSTFHDKVYINNNENGTYRLREIRDLIYPVGSIYMSVNNTNPKFLFGGEWSALTDRFLIGAGSSYAVNATGGSTALAAHTHSIPALSGTAASNGGHAHTFYLPPNWSFKIGTGTKNTTLDEPGSGLTQGFSTSSNGAHTHSVSTNASTSGSTGSGNAGNMPPYLAVYMWKRTS